ncbi:MAG: peptidylprolyl isomerase [Symbiobacteriia bacterium]
MAGVLLLGGCASNAAATVNGTKITEKELDTRMAIMSFIQGGDASAYRDQVLDDMINENLLLQEAKARGIKADPTELQKDLSQMNDWLLYHFLPQDLQAQAAQGQAPQLTDAQRATAEKQKADALKKANLSVKDFEDLETRQFTIRPLVDQVVKGVSVSDADVSAYYDAHKDQFTSAETVRASHILIAVGDDKNYDKILPKAQQVLKEAQAPGADFAALAQKYSDDPGSKDQGGDLGEFGRGQMVAEFDQAAFSLKPGVVSPLIKTQFGYHIIKVAEHKMPAVQPLTEVKAQVQQQALQEKQNDVWQKFLSDLKTKAKITRKAESKPSAPKATP